MLVLAALAVVVVLAASVLVLGGVVAARHRAESAADLAALAGAAALQDGQDACAAAASLARANGATVGCRVEGEDVVVDAAVPLPPAARRFAPSAAARARAGPPTAP